jgi:hypothetical protein
MLRAVLIMASLVVTTPCFAQEVRVITGDIEHVYGPGAELLDSADLQARNQRAWERRQTEVQVEIARQLANVEIKRFRFEEALVAASLGYWPR